MTTRDQEFLKRLLATFAVEAEEHLNAISAGLLEMEKAPTASKQKDLIETIFREAHSLKGAARAVDLADIGSICQQLESVFAALKGDDIAWSTRLSDLCHDAIGMLSKLLAVDQTAPTAIDRSILDFLVHRLRAASTGSDSAAEPAPVPIGDEGSAVEGFIASDTGSPEAGSRKPALQPLTTGQAAVAETIRVTTSKLDSLFRQAEEMIAAKLSAEQRVTDLRTLAGDLEARRNAWSTMHTHLVSAQLALEREAQKEGRNGSAPATARIVELLSEECAAARVIVEKLGGLTASAEHDRRALGKMVDGLLEDAKKLLMVPLSSLLEILPRLVRDLARDQGKEADLMVHGAEIEIDRRIQEEMKDPLIHLIRNCVDHGIERPAERARKDKPARGTITVVVFQKDAGKAEIAISDDGAGIDPAKVVLAAQKLGFVSSDEASRLREQEVMSLVFRSGVSTSTIVTDLSGRGLGLAIVREKVEKLGGSISVESRRDAGTTIRIVLPLTLSAFRGLVVRAGDQVFVLPTVSVERVVRVARENIKTVENRETVEFNGRAVSLVRLGDVLELPQEAAADPPGAFEQIVVLASGGERIAFVVDGILNEQEVLLKGLGPQLARVRNIAGATLLGTGTLAPVLNVPDLMKSSVKAAAPRLAEARAPAGEARKQFILVVEDSITARSLLKNILEASGYEVRTAVDGIDALTTLKTGQINLVVSDVEMPRMDGFDLTAKIRADKTLAELPVVLVTALESREHRERGIDVGANAYIVKSSFDQSGLLEVIRRLI